MYTFIEENFLKACMNTEDAEGMRAWGPGRGKEYQREKRYSHESAGGT